MVEVPKYFHQLIATSNEKHLSHLIQFKEFSIEKHADHDAFYFQSIKSNLFKYDISNYEMDRYIRTYEFYCQLCLLDKALPKYGNVYLLINDEKKTLKIGMSYNINKRYTKERLNNEELFIIPVHDMNRVERKLIRAFRTNMGSPFKGNETFKWVNKQEVIKLFRSVSKEFKIKVRDEEKLKNHLFYYEIPDREGLWCSYEVVEIILNRFVEEPKDRKDLYEFLKLTHEAMEKDAYCYQTFNELLNTDVEFIILHKYRLMKNVNDDYVNGSSLYNSIRKADHTKLKYSSFKRYMNSNRFQYKIEQLKQVKPNDEPYYWHENRHQKYLEGYYIHYALVHFILEDLDAVYSIHTSILMFNLFMTNSHRNINRDSNPTAELNGGESNILTFYPIVNKDSLEMNLQHVIIRCPELAELKLPNAKVLSSNEFPSNSCMIHIPERLYFQYKDYAHLTVYVKPRDSYFHLENFMPNITIREGVGSSYEQVQGKSNRIRVERLKEIHIHDESVHDETSNTSISDCSGKLKYTSGVHSMICSRLKEKHNHSQDRSNERKGFRLKGGMKRVIILDEDLPNKEWWIEKSKTTGIDCRIAEDLEELAKWCHKDNDLSYEVMCTWENRNKFQDAGFRKQYIFTDKEVDDEAHDGKYWEYPVIEHVKEGLMSVYGKNVFSYYKAAEPYEFVFNHFIDLNNNQYITGPSAALFSFYIDQFIIKEYNKVNYILCKYCQRRNIIRTSHDVKCLGNGYFNIALNMDEDVIRIHINYEDPFDRKGAEVLMNEKNTGFVPVKKVGEDYTIVSLCHGIDQINKDKAKSMFIKLRKFFNKHQDLFYVDYHWGNIMELNNEYVVVDIDLNMLGEENLKMKRKPLKELIDSEQKTGWNLKLYLSLLDSFKIKPSSYSMTMVAIELFEAVDYKRTFILTQDIIDDVHDRLKPLMNKKNDKVQGGNLNEGSGKEKCIPELSSNIEEHLSCLSLDRNEISAFIPSSTINDHGLVDESSSSISVESSAELNGGNKSRFKYVKIRSRPYLIIYFHGINPHGIKFHRSITETIRLYCQSAEYSFGYYLRGKENELTDQDIDRIELKPLHEKKASISKQSQVKLNTIAYNDVFDLDREFKLFDKALHDEFKDLLKLKNIKIYFLGHSYGACFSKYFAMKLNAKLDVTSISLDGSDLYNAVPLFINEYINGGYVKITDEVKIKPEDIKFGPKEIIYEGGQLLWEF